MSAPSGLPVHLPLSEAQGWVLNDLRLGNGLCGHSTLVLARLRKAGLIERDPDADPTRDGDRHRLTAAGAALATVAAEHRLTTSRRPLGYGAVRGSGMRYGVNGRCSCGWKGYSNESASKGGTSAVRFEHARHLVEVLAAG